MNKTVLILAALTLGTAAIAQAPTTTPDASTTAGQPPMTTTAPTGDMAAPAAAPTDAGTPAPAPTDAGAPQGSMTGGAPAAATASPAPAPVDTSNYPRCSRTVTDKCVSGPVKARRRR